MQLKVRAALPHAPDAAEAHAARRRRAVVDEPLDELNARAAGGDIAEPRPVFLDEPLDLPPNARRVAVRQCLLEPRYDRRCKATTG